VMMAISIYQLIMAYLTNHYSRELSATELPVHCTRLPTTFFPGQDLVVRKVTVGRKRAPWRLHKTVWDEILVSQHHVLPVLARQSESVGLYSLAHMTGGTTLYDLARTKRSSGTMARVNVVQRARALIICIPVPIANFTVMHCPIYTYRPTMRRSNCRMLVGAVCGHGSRNLSIR
jgi:hypothetical protein